LHDGRGSFCIGLRIHGFLTITRLKYLKFVFYAESCPSIFVLGKSMKSYKDERHSPTISPNSHALPTHAFQ